MEKESAISKEQYMKLVGKLIDEKACLVLETHFQKGQIPRLKRHETLLDEDVKKIVEV